VNRFKLFGVAALSLGLMLGCEHMPWSSNKARNATGKVAVAHIHAAGAAATQPAMGNPSGTVTFTQTGDQVRVQAKLKGLTPGVHGFHIHQSGDLSAADLSSAGGHFNPQHEHHGGPTDANRHAGDLGNITADANGKATLDRLMSGISVSGTENDIVGKSVIVHAKADDLKSDPSGNSGARIAGGVIELQK
jgi:Cu-Zn family superoxide dismutase